MSRAGRRQQNSLVRAQDHRTFCKLLLGALAVGPAAQLPSELLDYPQGRPSSIDNLNTGPTIDLLYVCRVDYVANWHNIESNLKPIM